MAKSMKTRTARAAERWRKVIDEWRRSGLGVREFCRGRGVSRYSFYSWRRRLHGTRPAKPPRPTAHPERNEVFNSTEPQASQ